MKGYLALLCIGFLALSCQSIENSVIPPPPSQRVPADYTPAWSPNGEYIAYSHYQQAFNDTLVTGLYVLELATGTRRLVAPGRTLHPSWFSDSRRIAFAAGPIYMVDIDNPMPTVLIAGTCYAPSVSPNDTAIAYDAPYGISSGSVVWVFALGSQTARDIRVHGQGEWKRPRRSPDGTRILHFRYSGSPNGTTELFTMDPMGESTVQLTHNSIDDVEPTWSPPGTMIAWCRSNVVTEEIWTSSSDGSNSRRLAAGLYPSFSPDGTKIVFVDPFSADSIDLHVINIDGTGYTPLSRGSLAPEDSILENIGSCLNLTPAPFAISRS